MLTLEERNELIEKYLPLANKLAWKECKRTPPSVDIEELKSAAYLGLVEAASKCTSSKTFSSFAMRRISGAIKDYLRQLRWNKKGVTVSSLEKHLDLESRKSENSLQFLVDGLNPLGRKLIFMYYVEGYTLKEIGAILGVTESRVSQMLSVACNCIRHDAV